MGQSISSVSDRFFGTLPPTIPSTSLRPRENGEGSSDNPGNDTQAFETDRQQLCHSLLTRGYAVIKLPETTLVALTDTRKHIHTFFSTTPLADKLEMRLPIRDDPLLRIRPNRGYVSGKVKEFLKLRHYPDDDKLFPQNPPELEGSFRAAIDGMKEISLDAFMTIAQSSDVTNKHIKELTKTVQDFFEEGSSLSVIHYYKLSEQPTEFNKETSEYAETEDEKVQIDTSTHLVLGEHRDTGLLTFIEVGTVPGLEVWDPVLNRWIVVERELPTGHGVLIMGRKLELFLSQYKATLHRVVIDKEQERYSVLWFMDLSSGKNNE